MERGPGPLMDLEEKDLAGYEVREVAAGMVLADGSVTLACCRTPTSIAYCEKTEDYLQYRTLG